MKESRFWVTNGQNVTVKFVLKFSFIPKREVKINLTLNNALHETAKSAKLLPGKYYTELSRQAQFSFLIPNDVKDSINPLGEFEITEAGKQIYHEELAGVVVKEQTEYFEKLLVPRDLEELGFYVEAEGHKNKPDAIAYHKTINSHEKIDVESTLTSNYDIGRWGNEKEKFERYKQERNLARLLIVCHSDNITGQVLEQLNIDPRPITLIEYHDLVKLKQEFRRTRDHALVYAKLTGKGRATVGPRISSFKWIPPREFKIERNIGLPRI